jgi:hypothetical protein
MLTSEQIYRHFLRHGACCKDGKQRTTSMGTLSNVFMVAYRTGKIHSTARARGTAANAAARAGIRRRKLDSERSRNA